MSDSGLKAKAKFYGSEEEILCSLSNAIFFILSFEVLLLGEDYVNGLLKTVLYSNKEYYNGSEQEINERVETSLGLRVFDPLLHFGMLLFRT